MAQVDRLIGAALGNYVIASRLGAGGMGQVYEAVQPAIGARVAIKVLHADAADPTTAQRFLREAQAVNRISSDGVAKIIDAGYTSDGRPYLVMEFLDGASLAELMVAGKRLPLGTACKTIADVLGVLAAAHAEGIVHRDLKPHNIFLTRTGRTVVLDFGVAKLLDSSAPVSLTLTGAIVGTPAYMAPEQIQGDAIDGRADLYSAGVVLYELATGRRPFEGEETAELLRLHVARRPPPPRAIRPDVPAAVQSVLMSALAKDPAGRFQTAEAMRAALLSAAAQMPADAFAPLALPPRRVMTRPPAEPPLGEADTRAATVPASTEAPTRVEGRARFDTPPPGASTAVPRSRRPLVIAVSLVVVGVALAVAIGVSLGGGGAEPNRAAPAGPPDAPRISNQLAVASTAAAAMAEPAPGEPVPLEAIALPPGIEQRLIERRLDVADLPRHAHDLVRDLEQLRVARDPRARGVELELARLVEQVPYDDLLVRDKLVRVKDRIERAEAAGLDRGVRRMARAKLELAERHWDEHDLTGANFYLFAAEWWVVHGTTPPW